MLQHFLETRAELQHRNIVSDHFHLLAPRNDLQLGEMLGDGLHIAVVHPKDVEGRSATDADGFFSCQ